MSIFFFPRLVSWVRPSALALAPLAALMTAEVTLAATALTEFEDSPKVVIDQAWQIINQDYVDNSFNQVDWQAVRQELLGREYTSQDAA
ncbi:MAG: hypothetical protein WBG38_12895, partial [Nodosilinea sp.]